MRLVIFANGRFPAYSFIQELLQPGDRIICADGGAARALSLGLTPSLVVGDMDSLAPEARRELESRGASFEVHPAAKDQSDLELAMLKALELHPGEIIILGALGDRFDHAHANVMLLGLALERGIPARIVDETHEIRIFDQELVLEGNPGDCLSLFTLGPSAAGVTTAGLKYPLNGETLYRGSTRGLSNEFAASRARITAASGPLLAIKTRSSTIRDGS